MPLFCGFHRGGPVGPPFSPSTGASVGYALAVIPRKATGPVCIRPNGEKTGTETTRLKVLYPSVKLTPVRSRDAS